MQLSRFTDLGLRALMRLAVGSGAEERVTVKLIARQVNASENYVAKAVSKLAELGFVESQRGRTGGIFLTEAGRTTTLGRITRALEGDCEVIDCVGDNPCPLAGACNLRGALGRAQEAFYAELDRHTIMDVVDQRTVDLLYVPFIPAAAFANE